MVALAAHLVCACASSGTVSGSLCDSSPTAISAATDYLVDRDNARDLEGVLAGYTEDVVWLPPSGEPVAGKDAIRSRYEDLFSTHEINLRSVTAEAFAEGQVGFVRGSTTGTLTPLDGEPIVPVSDKFIAMVRCDSGHWRVSHLMWSPLPQAESR